MGRRKCAVAKGGFIPTGAIQFPGSLRGLPSGAKKKMRSLGSVQMPTEAFMAVLRLDEN